MEEYNKYCLDKMNECMAVKKAKDKQERAEKKKRIAEKKAREKEAKEKAE